MRKYYSWLLYPLLITNLLDYFRSLTALNLRLKCSSLRSAQEVKDAMSSLNKSKLTLKVSERALRKTSILAMNPATWLQTAKIHY